jgi:ribosomal protein S1
VSPKGGEFPDPLDDLLREASRMSDDDLERAMAGAGPAQRKPVPPDLLEPGTTLRGIVVDVRGGEVLLELDGKYHGIVDEEEFPGELPRVGEEIQAKFERYDAKRGLAVLSFRGAQRQVFWDQLYQGARLEGTVSALTKGGLILDVRGARAFLPISQVELSRVEDLGPYLGRRLKCQVTSFDRTREEIVVSRRPILEEEGEVQRRKLFETLSEGQILTGTVKRITAHGAFVDLGGVDGLLPDGKIKAQGRKEGPEALREGQRIGVQIVKLDRERERVSLDFQVVAADSWGPAIEHYAVGDEVTGWVSARIPRGAVVTLEEGIEGLLPAETFHLLSAEPHPGSILRAVIQSIDRESREVLLRPASSEADAGTDG